MHDIYQTHTVAYEVQLYGHKEKKTTSVGFFTIFFLFKICDMASMIMVRPMSRQEMLLPLGERDFSVQIIVMRKEKGLKG